MPRAKAASIRSSHQRGTTTQSDQLWSAAQDLLAQHRASQVQDVTTRHSEARSAESRKGRNSEMSVLSSTSSVVELPNKEFSGYVSVADLTHLISEEHFQAQEGVHFLVGENAMKFRFRRQVRRSLLMSLGMEKEEALKDSMQLDLDVYAKSENKDARKVFLAIIVGTGSLQLPASIAKAGLLPGVGIMLCLSALNYFICNRIVETPFLLEHNYENLVQTTEMIGGATMVRTITFLSILTWCFPCIYYFSNIRGQVEVVMKTLNQTTALPWFPEAALEHAAKVHEHREKFIYGAMGMVALFFIFCAVRAKTIRTIGRASKYSWHSMVVMLGCIVMGAGWHAIVHRQLHLNALDYLNILPLDDETTANESLLYAPEKCLLQNITSMGSEVALFTSFKGFQNGLNDMMLAFGGIMIIPYVVAEMNNPEDAQHVISSGVGMISVFYITVGVIGYLGFGNFVLCGSNIPDLMADLGTWAEDLSQYEHIFYIIIGTTCHICIFLKSVAIYPLFLWPMLREFKFLVAYHEDPATELQLPWAQATQTRWRFLWRLCICAFVLTAAFFLWIYFPLATSESDKYDDVSFLVINIVNLFCTFWMCLLFPALIALFAITRHRILMEAREMRKEQLLSHRDASCCPSLRTPLNAEAIKYAGGSYCVHYMLTVITVLLILPLGYLLFDSMVGQVINTVPWLGNINFTAHGDL